MGRNQCTPSPSGGRVILNYLLLLDQNLNFKELVDQVFIDADEELGSIIQGDANVNHLDVITKLHSIILRSK